MHQSRSKKNTLLLFVSVATLFLSGCQAWTGLAAERYDGQKVEPDTEAIESYRRDQEITGKSKELYLIDPFSSEISDPPLAFVEEAAFLLDNQTYTTGNELPASRYTFTIVDPMISKGNIRLEDSNGELIAEEYLHPHMGVISLTVNLNEGDVVLVSGTERGDLVAVSSGVIPSEYEVSAILNEPSLEADTRLLYTGIWEVGTHIDAGDYEIIEQPPNGYVYIFEPNETDPRIIELNGQNESDPTTGESTDVSDPLPLTLKEGQTLYVQEAVSIQLKKKE